MRRIGSGLICFWLVTGVVTPAQTTTGIRGQVLDAATGKPLPGTNVLVENTDRGAAADSAGNFRIVPLHPGYYNLRFDHIGYSPLIKLNVHVVEGRVVDLPVRLVREPISLAGVTVSRQYFEKDADVMGSNRTVDQEELRRDPGGAYDIQRMVQSLPSVVSSADQQNEIVVRGGGPGENLFLMDNIEIANPNHFGQQGTGGGPVNMINPYLVDRIDFVAGAFPAKYGNKLSSVMNIHLREGNRTRSELSLDMNMSGAGIVAEGPLRPWEGTYLFSWKRSYLDFVIRSTGLTAVPVYWNTQTKITFRPSPSDHLALNWIYGRDAVDVVGENDAWTRGTNNVDVDGDQGALGLTWRHLWQGNGMTRVTVASTRAWFRYDVFRFTPRGRRYRTYYQNDVEYDYQGKLDFLWQPTAADEIRGGMDLKDLGMANRAQAVNDTIWLWGYRFPGSSGMYVTDLVDTTWRQEVFPVIQDADSTVWDSAGVYHYGVADAEGHWHWVDVKPVAVLDLVEGYHLNHAVLSLRSSAFLQWKRSFRSGWDLVVGARWGSFALNRDSWISPRVSLSYHLTPATSLHLAYGRHHQIPALKLMLWDDHNRSLSSKWNDQWVAGLDTYFTADTRGTLEVYWKRTRDIPLSMADLTPDSADVSRIYVNHRVATARGVEWFLQKKMARDLFGTVSWSWYTTAGEDYRLPQHVRTFPLDYDFHQVLNIIAGYRLPFRTVTGERILHRVWWKKVLAHTLGAGADELEFSFRYRYSGGKPYTPQTYDWNTRRWYIAAHQPYNSRRFPFYSRLDVMIMWHVRIKSVAMTSYIDIQNVFDRDNIWDFQYNDDGTRENIYQFKVFPVGGITLEF
ncbi:MAG: hypothetical protein D6762_02610 [Candidatus Neomarinimicrobiota bacterium]|nr:MAG: hypothetical protein D6762_02610 [Candidatus Neomarinimicrobiota bacterium]